MKLYNKATLNEPGKIFGMPMIQTKNSITTYKEWLKETHKNDKYFTIIITVVSITIYFIVRDVILAILIGMLLILLIDKIRSKQYNKQAPENLKRR